MQSLQELSSKHKVSNPQHKVSNPQDKVSNPQNKVSNPQNKVSNPQNKVSNPQLWITSSILNNQFALSNACAKALFALNKHEKLLLVLTASKLKVGNDLNGQPYPKLKTYNERTVQFTSQEFAEFCDINPRTCYKSLNKTIKSLFTKSVSYTYEVEKPFVQPKQMTIRTFEYNILESIDYPKNGGDYQVTFTSPMVDNALQVKKHFSTYKLGEVYKLKSHYSFRLFEILNQYDGFSKIFSIDELRQLLQAPISYNWNIFRNTVLMPALKELTTPTEHAPNAFESIGFDLIKQGSRVTEIKFTPLKRKS